jgi:hypothetical protein
MPVPSYYGSMRIHERPRWRSEVTRILDECGEDRRKAARLLGISTRVLRTWARELGYDKLRPGPKKELRA